MSFPPTKRLRVIVHGGMHKTGTKSLQHILGVSRKVLLAEGICYPDVADTHHDMLAVKRSAWTPSGCLASLQQAQRLGAETVIFSSEMVSALSADQFKMLTACFVGHELTYLFCFRHWHDYFWSRWSQNCIRRDSQTFGAFVQAVTCAGSVHPVYRFDLVLGRAAESGNCRVAAVSYDNAVATEGSVLPALLRAAGLAEHLVRRFDAQQDRLNVHAGRQMVELCRLFNGIVADRRNLPQDDLCRSVAEFRTCRQSFDLHAQVEALNERVRDGLFAHVAKHDSTTPNFPDFDPVLQLLSREHANRFTNKIDGRIFVEKAPAEIRYSTMEWRDFRGVIRDIPGAGVI